jgi:hypothetical protein
MVFIFCDGSKPLSKLNMLFDGPVFVAISLGVAFSSPTKEVGCMKVIHPCLIEGLLPFLFEMPSLFFFGNPAAYDKCVSPVLGTAIIKVKASIPHGEIPFFCKRRKECANV